jgi:hypothetical protein
MDLVTITKAFMNDDNVWKFKIISNKRFVGVVSHQTDGSVTYGCWVKGPENTVDPLVPRNYPTTGHRNELIIDLITDGFSQKFVSTIMGVSQTTISIIVKNARLTQILD